MCAFKTNGLPADQYPASNGNGHKNGQDPRKTTLSIPPVNNGKLARNVRVVNFDDIDEYGPSFAEAYEPTEIVTGDKEQFDKVHDAIHDLLDAFNVNWEDPNYTDTPKRVAKAYLDYWVSGYGRDPEDEVTVFPNSSGTGDLVVVKDMRYYSMCSHHLAPFFGYGAIAYMPGENLLGLSKLGRILDIFARRFQLQERIGAQTADKIMELLQPEGVMVVLYDSQHMCMSSRGVQMHEANTTTVAARGVFKDNADLRREVLSMIQK